MTVTTSRLPELSDYAGWARRFTETCRQNRVGGADLLPQVREYAQAVREECAQEAGRWGVDPSPIRERSASATMVLAGWRERMAQEGAHEPLLDQMFREVRTGQIQDAIREASYQSSIASSVKTRTVELAGVTPRRR